MKRLLAISLLITLSNFAHASVASIRKAEKACMDQASSQVDMARCSAQAYAGARSLLSEKVKVTIHDYKNLIKDDQRKGVNPQIGNVEFLRRFLRYERTWQAFSEANCAYEAAGSLGGSGQWLEENECNVEATLKHIADL